MKMLLVILTFISTLNGFTQESSFATALMDTKTITPTQKEYFKAIPGIYLTREEFVNQTPSFHENITIKQGDFWYKRDTLTPAIVLNQKEFWAYVNHSNVFFYHKGLKPLETIGTYCIFYRSKLQFGFKYLLGSSLIFPTFSIEEIPYLLHAETGLVTRCNSNQLKKIIKTSNPELLPSFKQDLFKRDRQKKYVRILNRKNPL
jgi:hypothetical protein